MGSRGFSQWTGKGLISSKINIGGQASNTSLHSIVMVWCSRLYLSETQCIFVSMLLFIMLTAMKMIWKLLRVKASVKAVGTMLEATIASKPFFLIWPSVFISLMNTKVNVRYTLLFRKLGAGQFFNKNATLTTTFMTFL